MSRLLQRSVWGVVAAAGLVLAPLPAFAADDAPAIEHEVLRPADPGADTMANYQVGPVNVVGLCGAFTATNGYTGSIELWWGEVGYVPDGTMVLAQGQTVRIPTTRSLVDYDAYMKGTEVVVGAGDDIVVDQGCNERYVTNVYQDLFDRAPDPQGLSSWSAALKAGTPRVQVANAITYSTEFRSTLITGVYEEFLGRGPDAGGLTNWLAAMSSGVTIAQMESGFIASDEYYTQSGSTNEGWVQNLYSDVLGRAAGTSEVASWTSALSKGASRQKVAMGFLLSTERLNTVVEGYYQFLLFRGVDTAGQAAWVQILQAGGRDEAIIGGIIASDEYYDAS